MSNDFKLDVIGVGAAKSGTTWTASILDAHPQTCLGRGKELNYFLELMPPQVQQRLGTTETKMKPLGIEWLKEQFTHWEPGQLKGEFSPRYFVDPGSPRLIHEHNPDVKLLINLRNPTEAAYSFYYQYSTIHPTASDFEQAMKDEPEALKYYEYINAIEKYLKYFKREQMNIVLMDDIKADSQKVYRDLCEFINVEAVPLEAVTKRANTASVIRSRKARRLFFGVQTFVGKHASTRWIRDQLVSKTNLKKSWGKVKQMNVKRQKYEDIKQETREQLIEIFREPNERLSEFLGRDLSAWNDPNPKKKAATSN